METRLRTVTMIAVCTGIFALWFVFVTYYNKKYPQPPPGSAQEQVSNTGATPSTTSTTQKRIDDRTKLRPGDFRGIARGCDS